MNFPSDLKYTSEHEWIRVEGNIGIVGITDFAQKELGDIVYVDIPVLGKTIAQNEVFGSIETVKVVSDLFSPVSGKVIEVNTSINDAPEKINRSPYDEGWLIKIEIANPQELENLLSAEEYQKLIKV
ncbi:MAG: glycine cleavage system protein GcvH [Bacteroidia bacterium]|nr:glycine cleavage system protein GcvH [Bacteroidia bacterium]MDW8303033.1 glycine cleavage system protein GcvH [Bacteroidia bacterium]